MKIGLVRRTFSKTGGAEYYLQLLGRALNNAGHECVLFASEEWTHLDWRHGELRTVPGKTRTAFANELRALAPRSFCDVLFSVDRIWGCDFFRAGEGVHAAWLDRQCLYLPRWRSWIARRQWVNREALMLESAVLDPAATRRVITNSRLVKAEIVNYYQFPEERIHVIYNGVPPAATSAGLREQTRRLHGFGSEDFIVLFAGSNWARSGLRYAIEAIECSDVPRIRLMVVGRGSRSDWAHSRRVRFVGALGDLSPCLSAADVFLLPSIYDPFSNACLEAMAAGLPVITTDANGFAEVLKPGIEGEVLPTPSDIPALVQALKDWSDPARRAAIAPRLKKAGARFDIESNLKATVSLLTEPQA